VADLPFGFLHSATWEVGIREVLGVVGIQRFQISINASMAGSLSPGEAGPTFAPLGYYEKLKKGLMHQEEVTYMLRGGSWDNSDVRGAKSKLRWSKTDREYEKGGYKKEHSVSILRSGSGFDWTGKGTHSKSALGSFPGLS
jgi:hypothetical protein